LIAKIHLEWINIGELYKDFAGTRSFGGMGLFWNQKAVSLGKLTAFL
jgi:hypothetical protein